MKGWKTFIFGGSLILLGVLQSDGLSMMIGGCVFDAAATQPETCTIPAKWLGYIGAVVTGLRWVTKTPIFKNDVE